jgi:formamidopyrimidine-DNA glycosylase
LDVGRRVALPEYPDITVYIERLLPLVSGQPLEQIRIASPFFLRTVEPSIDAFRDLTVQGIERLGKRVVLVCPKEHFLVVHLMISGRLHWKEVGCRIPLKKGLAALDFPHGSLLITEASTKKRASLHLAKGRQELKALDPGGLEVFEATFEQFREAVTAENHTLKRSLTDPKVLSGIGNAYSDEILHRARLSPVLLTAKASEEELLRLFSATKETLLEATERIRKAVGEGFPEKVTAFRDDMAVHGRYGQPCRNCGSKVQRIRYSSNETNYCPQCQTRGRLLADRALSQLLKKDWPGTPEELEERFRAKNA